MLKKWLVLAAILLAALVSYGYGFSHGLLLFIVLGMVLEMGFWLGIFGKKTSFDKKT